MPDRFPIEKNYCKDHSKKMRGIQFRHFKENNLEIQCGRTNCRHIFQCSLTTWWRYKPWTIVLTVTIEPPTIQSTPPAPHISSSHTAWEPKKYGVNKRRGIKTEYRWQIAGYIWWDIAGAYYSLSSSPLIQCCVFRDTFLLCKWEKIPC